MTNRSLVRRIRPLCATVLACIRQAFQEWESCLPRSIRRSVDGASRGIFIWERSWFLIKEAFDGDDRIEFNIVNSTPVLCIKRSGIKIKLNRVDPETNRPHHGLSTSNSESKQPLLFETGEVWGIPTFAIILKSVDQLRTLDRVLLVLERIDCSSILARLDGPDGIGESPTPVTALPSKSPPVRLRVVNAEVSEVAEE